MVLFNYHVLVHTTCTYFATPSYFVWRIPSCIKKQDKVPTDKLVRSARNLKIPTASDPNVYIVIYWNLLLIFISTSLHLYCLQPRLVDASPRVDSFKSRNDYLLHSSSLSHQVRDSDVHYWTAFLELQHTISSKFWRLSSPDSTLPSWA